MNPLLITFLLGLTFTFPILLAFAGRQKASRLTRHRLSRIQDSVRIQKDVEDDLGLADLQSFSARLGGVLERYAFSRKLRMLLVHAGSNRSVGGAVLASAGTGLGCGIAVFLAFRMISPAILAIIAGTFIPYAVLRIKSARRLKRFNEALPDAIDLLARSLRAGHSVASSIEVVAEQSPEPLAFEFVQVFQQQRLGLQFRDALLQMCTRIASRDLQFLVTAILVQKETGGDLTEILERTAYVIRERVRIEGEVRTRTAQGRLTGWILASLPAILLALINIVSPGYSNVLVHDPVGQQLLCCGAVMIVIGGLIIRKIVNIQV